MYLFSPLAPSQANLGAPLLSALAQSHPITPHTLRKQKAPSNTKDKTTQQVAHLLELGHPGGVLQRTLLSLNFPSTCILGYPGLAVLTVNKGGCLPAEMCWLVKGVPAPAHFPHHCYLAGLTLVLAWVPEPGNPVPV